MIFFSQYNVVVSPNWRYQTGGITVVHFADEEPSEPLNITAIRNWFARALALASDESLQELKALGQQKINGIAYTTI